MIVHNPCAQAGGGHVRTCFLILGMFIAVAAQAQDKSLIVFTPVGTDSATFVAAEVGFSYRVTPNTIELWVGANAVEPLLTLSFAGSTATATVLASSATQGATSLHIENLYPGISLNVSGRGRQLQFELETTPGADISVVDLMIAGAAATRLTQTAAAFTVRGGTVHLNGPMASQTPGHPPLTASLTSGANGSLRLTANGQDPEQSSRLLLLLDHSSLISR